MSILPDLEPAALAAAKVAILEEGDGAPIIEWVSIAIRAYLAARSAPEAGKTVPVAPKDAAHNDGCEHSHSPVWLCNCPRPATQAVPAEDVAGLIAERDALKRHCENLAAIVEDRMKDTRLVSAGGRGEGFGFDLMGGPIPYIAEYLVQFMGLRDGAETNYSEMEVQHNEFGALTLTMQRRSGKTPHQLRKEAEAEATSLRRKLEEAERIGKMMANAIYNVHQRGLHVNADDMDSLKECQEEWDRAMLPAAPHPEDTHHGR